MDIESLIKKRLDSFFSFSYFKCCNYFLIYYIITSYWHDETGEWPTKEELWIDSRMKDVDNYKDEKDKLMGEKIVSSLPLL